MLFGMEKTITNADVNNANNFFAFIKQHHDTTFTNEQKVVITALYVYCKNRNITAINTVAKKLNTRNDAEDIVAAALYCAGYLADDKAGANLLAKKNLRTFIFNAFEHDNETAANFFQYIIECGIKVGNFETVLSFFSKILLKNPTNDKLYELPQGGLTQQFSNFIEDCEDDLQLLFKHATKISNRKILNSLKKLQMSFPKLSLDNDDSSHDDSTNSSSDPDDDSAQDSSEDSDGIRNHQKDWNDYKDYVYEHLDQLTMND